MGGPARGACSSAATCQHHACHDLALLESIAMVLLKQKTITVDELSQKMAKKLNKKIQELAEDFQHWYGTKYFLLSKKGELKLTKEGLKNYGWLKDSLEDD